MRKIEFYDPELVVEDSLLDQAKPHWVSAVSAIVALAASAYGQQQQAKARARQKRASANAAQQSGAEGGSEYGWSPTASKFTLGNDKGMGDVFKGMGQTPEGKASESQQGMSLGRTSLEPSAEPQSFEGTFQTADANKALPYDEIKPMQSEPPKQQSSSGGADVAGQIGGYGQLAMQMYDMYRQSKQGPPEGQVPQLGPMNTAPTARRFYR